MNRIIREAKPTVITDIMQVMEVAKKIMRSSGNMYQWEDGYPSKAVILNDMENHGGFVIEDADHIVGYFAFLPSPEPTYSKIYDAAWLAVGVGDGNATSLREKGIVNSEKFATTTEWYDLQGRQVNSPRQGLYIRNGRKFIVK